MDIQKGLVIVPTYNERDNIAELAAEVLAVDRRLDILFVDDNSPDGTGQLADRLAGDNARIQVLHRPRKLGLGTAYLAGFRQAVAAGYDVVFEMDADLSHHPRYLPDLLAAIQDCDLAIGSRYSFGVNVVHWPMHRLLLSYTANLYTRLVTGMPVHDATSGFRCYRRRTLEAIALDQVVSEGYAFQIEMAYRCWRKGLRLREVPIIFADRHRGATKMSRRIIAEALWIVWRLRLASLFGRLERA
ncbi:MAG: polyprenol monophosphomannose synthase [Thermodesulfobacteriota bacterium]